mmetsp:Transcript_4877/g.11630  ORF Transcript_4877/g.11630 Transcript_4877/m.11630 type:complete len:101 (-) Transcript_4877:95-397(-)
MDRVGDSPAPVQLERLYVIVGIEDGENQDLEETNATDIGSQQQKASFLHPICVFIAGQFERRQVAVYSSPEQTTVGTNNVARIGARANHFGKAIRVKGKI